MRVFFLGTGGGRYVTSLQKRATGGIVVTSDKTSLIIDPGPCSLCRIIERQVNPRFDAMLISHGHTDHCAGAPAVIEAMTGSTREKRGALICPADVLEDNVNHYYQSLLEEVRAVKPGDEVVVKDIRIKATPTEHSRKMQGVGFLLNQSLGYTGDTGYFPELAEAFKEVDTLIINLISGSAGVLPNVMTRAGAERLIKEARPKRVILTHFGVSMLRKGPENVARLIQEATGVRTLAAKDGLEIDLSKRSVLEWS